MKRVMTMCCAFVLATLMPASWAVDEHHPDGAKGAAAATQSAPPSKEAMDKQLLKMQAARDKAMKAKTPAERQKAMMEQMQVMQESMSMMKSMDGKMMQGMGMMNCPGMGGDDKMMMEHRARMMDMMMQMMMGQQKMMMPMKP